MEGFVSRQSLESLVCSGRFRDAVTAAMHARYGRHICNGMGYRSGSDEYPGPACPGATGVRLGPNWIRYFVFPGFEGDLSQVPLLMAALPEDPEGYPAKFMTVGLRVLYGLLLEDA